MPSLTFFRPALAQVPDALAARPARLMSHHVAAFHDDAADFLGHRHHLVDARAALIPVGAAACNRRARKSGCPFAISSSLKPSLSSASSGTSIGGLAVAAQAARQALRDDQADRGRDGVGLHAHVHQARQGLRRVVGVQRREHQVAGLRGLDGDLRRLEVADFADHDDVRVLAQEGAQRAGEGQAHLRVDVAPG